MVRPRAFARNAETAATNAFQAPLDVPPARAQAGALAEFDALSAALARRGVRVVVVEDTPEPAKPDALFPNNWVTFHADGTIVLYPLLVPSRRAEVRPEVVERLLADPRLGMERVLDLRDLEASGEALEGTGSLVLDRPRRVAYACRSPRTTPGGLAAFEERMGYRVFAFDAVDAAGVPIYHTNVMLALGTELAIVCLEAVPDAVRRGELARELVHGGRELVEIDARQMGEFAGNALELATPSGGRLLVMSARARRSLRDDQVRAIERSCEILAVELDTIERCGGGSARCMIAEVFPALPR